MLGLSLEETRVYQDASAEGTFKGEQALILCQLSRRVDSLGPDMRSQARRFL